MIEPLRYLSVCSGIEAASVAWGPLGWEPVALKHSATGRCDPSRETFVAHSLRADGFDASEDGTGRGTPLVPVASPIVAGIAKGAGNNDGKKGSPQNLILQPTGSVRRLTPRECERLQGFPDDWTLIEYRGKPAADGPRYKAIGNAMAVPVMYWLGSRIALMEEVRQ